MNSTTANIVPVSPAQHRTVAYTLALAFAEDPVMTYIFPEPKNRLRRIAGLMRLALRTYNKSGLIETFSDGCSAAVWQRPNPAASSLWDMMANVLEAMVKLRSCANRANAVELAIKAAKVEQPYWYLAILGTEPGCRGSWQGGPSRAGRLLQSVLDRCDQQQLPAYLESSSKSNIPFYNKYGFEVTQEITIEGGPGLWGMIRQPG